MRSKVKGLIIIVASFIFMHAGLFLFGKFIGSRQFSFLLIALILPIMGSFFKVKGSVLLTSVFFTGKWIFGLGAITFGIPTACAAAYWSLSSSEEKTKKIYFMNFALSVLVPIFAIIAFVAHPVGSQAFYYSFYWLIPIVLYFLPRSIGGQVFFVSLSGSFISHAVGSVVWLYTIPSVPQKWIALIPFVVVERLLFSISGVIVFLLFSRLFSILKVYNISKNISFMRNYL